MGNIKTMFRVQAPERMRAKRSSKTQNIFQRLPDFNTLAANASVSPAMLYPSMPQSFFIHASGTSNVVYFLHLRPEGPIR
jgi:hypothetical protein